MKYFVCLSVCLSVCSVSFSFLSDCRIVVFAIWLETVHAYAKWKIQIDKTRELWKISNTKRFLFPFINIVQQDIGSTLVLQISGSSLYFNYHFHLNTFYRLFCQERRHCHFASCRNHSAPPSRTYKMICTTVMKYPTVFRSLEKIPSSFPNRYSIHPLDSFSSTSKIH